MPKGVYIRTKPIWNKGLKTGLVPKSAFKKGQKPWNKGKPNLSIQNEKHWNWKGDKVGKGNGLHNWVRKQLGTPTTCEHCGKTGLTAQKIHWANKDHKYRRRLTDWFRLCVSCHRKYDYSNHLSNIGSRYGSVPNKH